MTSQTVILPSSDSMLQSQPASSQGAAAGSKDRDSSAIKVLYQSDQQEEYLDLRAQIESLLKELQTLNPA
jgi:hypothetical protein